MPTFLAQVMDQDRALTEPLQISEPTEFNAYITSTERGLSDRSKAEAIAAQTKRTIKENYHRDPEFYRRFSDKIKKLIEELKDARQEDLKALLMLVQEYQQQVSGYEADDIPEVIKERKEFHPFYRNLKTELEAHSVTPDQLSEMAQAMYKLVERDKIVDWHRNIEVQRRVRMALEDYLFDVARDEYSIPLSTDEIDNMITLVWNLGVENRTQ